MTFPAGLLEAVDRLIQTARTTVRAVSARTRPVTSVVGTLGWALLLVALVASWAGQRYGWQELVVIATFCAAVLLVAVGFVVGRSQYEVTLDLAKRRVVVGDRAVGRLEVRNSSDRTLLAAEIELPVGAGLASFPLPRLAAGEVHEDLFAVPTRHRGVIVLGPVRSVRGDALGILRRQMRWTDEMELFVHPRTVALAGASAGFLKDLEGRPTRDLSSSDVSFHALREYVAGDDRRHVHWRSTARTGRLMVRQFEETRRSHLAVALSTAESEYADADGFELAVSVAGSLGLQALRDERNVTLLVHGRTMRGQTGGRLLDDLTRVSTGSGRDSIVDLARITAAEVPDASAVVLLFGATVTPHEMHAAASRLPVDVRVLAVQCMPGSEVARHVIADLTVLVVGDLGDLPRALRSVGE
ncbi:DUF58 domain-containing protein [Pengzhenrongella phosphoraccumulans]|uniref:DUF58 domain-containing protein n=1 Tax=Pengzhenrongella phosphoraccumulans TaxID=3114394 RepID=UPI00388FD85D